MKEVGLGYLTINRVSSTLSGGETQRINLTRTLGSNLTSSLYISWMNQVLDCIREIQIG